MPNFWQLVTYVLGGIFALAVLAGTIIIVMLPLWGAIALLKYIFS